MTGAIPSGKMFQDMVELEQRCREMSANCSASGHNLVADLHIADAKDVQDAITMLRLGKVKETMAHFKHMDTALRNRIPNSVWNFCMNTENWE